jgi:hypothetical protein
VPAAATTVGSLGSGAGDELKWGREGFSERFILAVSKKLRVSPEVATGEFPGRILVYANAISPNTALRTLDEISEASSLTCGRSSTP